MVPKLPQIKPTCPPVGCCFQRTVLFFENNGSGVQEVRSEATPKGAEAVREVPQTKPTCL